MRRTLAADVPTDPVATSPLPAMYKAPRTFAEAMQALSGEQIALGDGADGSADDDEMGAAISDIEALFPRTPPPPPPRWLPLPLPPRAMMNTKHTNVLNTQPDINGVTCQHCVHITYGPYYWNPLFESPPPVL